MSPNRRLLAVAGLSCAALFASVSEARKIKPATPATPPIPQPHRRPRPRNA